MVTKFLAFIQLQKIFESLQGRSTAFFIAFFVTGNFFYWRHGKIDPSYLTFMGMLLAYVVGHSIKEDYFTTKTNGNTDDK